MRYPKEIISFKRECIWLVSTINTQTSNRIGMQTSNLGGVFARGVFFSFPVLRDMPGIPSFCGISDQLQEGD